MKNLPRLIAVMALGLIQTALILACVKSNPPPQVDDKTKKETVEFMVTLIKIWGDEDVSARLEDWEVYRLPNKSIRYAVYKKDAVWGIDETTKMTVCYNESARKIAPRLPITDNYDPAKEITYDKLITHIKAQQ